MCGRNMNYEGMTGGLFLETFTCFFPVALYLPPVLLLIALLFFSFVLLAFLHR